MILKNTTCELGLTNCKLRVASYELKFKSASSKPRV